MERWERRLLAAERKPVSGARAAGSDLGAGTHAILAHSIAEFASSLRDIEPGTNVTVTVDPPSGERTSVRVHWEAGGRVTVLPLRLALDEA
jgi:hypothetical protein